MSKRLVVLELTDQEESEFEARRDELLKSRSRLNKIPISVNEIDIEEWERAFSIAGPYAKDIRHSSTSMKMVRIFCGSIKDLI